jgi:predicted FMN-binding regulatory protein PaiB
MQSLTTTVPTLPLEKALELVPLADGNLCVNDLPLLSLPCIMERRELPSRLVIVTHLDRSRESYLSALLDKPAVRIQFVIAFHYIDPEWIPRSPHAPTEVKAVFEIRGRASLLTRDETKTTAMMDTLTKAKQMLFSPKSTWKIGDLPAKYIERLFPMIAEVEVEPDEYHLSRLMVLQHLTDEHRSHVLSKILAFDNSCSRAVSKLFEVAYR